jgi:hypothetical protein
MMVWLVYGVKCHFQQYFSYIASQFYWWRKLEYIEKSHWQTLSHTAASEYLNNIYALLEQISFPLIENEVLSNYLSKTPGKRKSVLLVEETGVHRKKSLTNFITYCCVEYTSPWMGFELTTLVVIGTDCTGSCKSNYHTITTMTAPNTEWWKDLPY